MYCLNLESTDPFFNLAVDEYLLKNRNDEILILGINDSTVVIGKHQVAHRETDTKFISEHNIPAIRRISGGGTVFHDRGNLNFSFILNSEQGKQVDFIKYTQPVIDFLAEIGVNAKFEGKNDLRFDGHKISGNAEHVYHNRVLHHGTLLFDSDLDLLKNCLRNDTGKYSTRAVNSNPSSVINLKYVLKYVLKDVLKDVDNIHGFRSLMMDWFLNNLAGSEKYELTPGEISDITELADSKYRTWEWNYGYGPEYHFENSFMFNGAMTSCRLHIKDGIIWESKVDGCGILSVAAKYLIGCRHMPNDVKDVLSSKNVLEYGFDVYKLF